MIGESSPGVAMARGVSFLFFQGLISGFTNLVFFTVAARILSAEKIGLVSALGDYCHPVFLGLALWLFLWRQPSLFRRQLRE